MAERGAAAAGGGNSGKDAKTTQLTEELEEVRELVVMKDIEIGQLKTANAGAEAKVAELGETKAKDDIKIDEVMFCARFCDACLLSPFIHLLRKFCHLFRRHVLRIQSQFVLFVRSIITIFEPLFVLCSSLTKYNWARMNC